MKRIFEGNTENSNLIHQQFQKFSKGIFENRAMIRAKNSNKKFTLNTTYEYAKELIMIIAEKLGNNKTHVTGALISTLILEGFNYKEKKSAIGVNKYIIDTEMTGNEIIELCKKIQKAFFALSFKIQDSELKIKIKSPKSSKSSLSSKKQGGKIKIDFCKLKTTDKKIITNFIFDKEAENFKNIEINHTFEIKDILISDKLKEETENNFIKIRELAKRKGKITRILNIDGKIIKKEKEFEI